MHPEVCHFTVFVKKALPQFFSNLKVLDVGGGDINGNNRFLFENCDYTANDVSEGRNVSIVCRTASLPFDDASFDVIVSTECFEHDPEHTQSLQKICKMLKPGGLFFFSCASTGRPEHGTRRTTKMDSFGAIANISDMVDYYKNLTPDDINAAIPFSENFSVCDTYYNLASKDIYFIGVKTGGQPISLPTYSAPLVSQTTSQKN